METINFDAVRNLPEALHWATARYGARPVLTQAFSRRDRPGTTEWRSMNRLELSTRVNRLAHFLIRLGVKKGTKVAILSNSRPEWIAADLAILSAGGITVSIYQSLLTNDVGYILNDSGAEIVFIENEEQLGKIHELMNRPCPIPEREGVGAHEARTVIRALISFEETTSHDLLTPFSSITEDESLPGTVPTSLQHVTRSDVASIVYTSGTTGPAKGVVQTHENHLSNIRQAAEAGIFGEGEGSLFLYLPLAHSFARLVGYLGVFTKTGLTFTSVADPRSSKIDLFAVMRELREGNSTVLPTVPRLFEKMKSSIEGMASRKSLGGYFLSYVLDHALIVRLAKAENRVPPLLSTFVRFVSLPYLAILKEKLVGSSFTHAISGGAKLPRDVNLFFDALGIEIYEGYGLTETCVATNVNRLGNKRYGSVGPPFRDVEVKIGSDGEILYRGPNISHGYYRRPQATRDSWDEDGWFHTGDIGYVDEDGYLFITDRKKDLIVTAGGKKVAPQMIEDRLKSSPFISQAVLCGESKPFCVALVTLENGNVKSELKNRGGELPDDFVTSPAVHQLIKSEIDKVNRELASFESIKKFEIMPGDFTIENGLLTPTLKVKRREVQKRFGDVIESMYAHGSAHGG